jgi:hypothetical protein
MRPPGTRAQGAHPPSRGEMTTQSSSDAKDLIILAERMGIPVDEAMRQVAQLKADERPPETAAPDEPVTAPALA